MKVPRSALLTGTPRRVGRHGLVWLRDPEARREERATTSLVMFIMFFPMIVGAFGFGVDFARNTWVRTSIQNAVDTAAVAGAGTTRVTTTGQVVVDWTKAAGQMRKLYALNRADNPGLACLGDKFFIPGTGGLLRCWTELPLPKVGSAAVPWKKTQFDVRERSSNAFLGILGYPYQTYHLTGKAVINRATE